MPMAVSHAMRSDVRTCPTRQNRNVPPPEPEPESNNGHPRRRIAVAVSSAWSFVCPFRLLCGFQTGRRHASYGGQPPHVSTGD